MKTTLLQFIKEARKYKSAEVFEKAINDAITSDKGNMISGIPIGNIYYNYSIAMQIDKAGYKNIKDFWKDTQGNNP